MQGDIEKVAQKSPIELTKFFELISGSDALEPDYNSLQEEMQQTEKKLDALHVKSRLITSRKKRICLLYTSPSPRDRQKSRMPSSA